MPLVAAFETGFHRTIPEANARYAVPDRWATEYGIRRWGFHGASHRYIAGRMAELLGRDDLRLISCHLGGSSSLCAIRGGQSVACSLGMSPQTGLPQNNRVGDFDVFALPVLLQRDRQDPGRAARHPGEQVGPGGPGRRGERPPRHRGGGRWRATTRRRSPSTSTSPRRATTSAPTSSSWAGPTRSSSPAGSARTRSASDRASAGTSTGSASSSIRRATPAGPPSGRSRPRGRASRSGPSRPTRRSSSPARPATSWRSGA